MPADFTQQLANDCFFRVLVHSDAKVSDSAGTNVDFLYCVDVFVSYKLESVSSRCLPSVAEGQTCLVPIILPLAWWPVYANDTRVPVKKKSILVSVTYTVHKVDHKEVCLTELRLAEPVTLDPNKPHMVSFNLSVDSFRQ